MSSRAAGADPTCDFCVIAQEQGRADIVAEGEAWVAFFPFEPATPGHTLVIPRIHVADLWSVDVEMGDALMRAVLRVGRAIDSALNPDGMNLITSAGRVAEQTLFHVHLHLVPRWRDDGFGRIWPPDRHNSKFTREKLVADIRSAYLALANG